MLHHRPCCCIVLVGLLGVLPGCQSIDNMATRLTNEWSMARRTSSPAGEKSSGIVSEKQKAEVQMAVARSLEDQGQTDQAIKLYLDVVSRHGHQPEAYHRLALLYGKKGDRPTAQKFYQLALKRAPKNAELQCDFGYSCYLARDWKTAEKSLRKATALQPALARAHNNLGLLLARTGREEEALKEFALGGCTEAGARSNLGLALALENHLPEARRQFELALATDPENAAARRGVASVCAAMVGAEPRAPLAAAPGDGIVPVAHVVSEPGASNVSP